jgi:hypothetical protein
MNAAEETKRLLCESYGTRKHNVRSKCKVLSVDYTRL